MSDAPAVKPWRANLPLGPAWFKLPLGDKIDPEALAAQVDARISRDPRLSGKRQELIDMLAHFARDATDREVMAAAVFWVPDELDGVLVATLYTTACERTASGPVDRWLDRLRSRLAALHAGQLSEPAMELRDLPAGKALRAQVMTGADVTSEPGQPRNGHSREVVLDNIQYWIPVPDRPLALLLTLATPNLAAAEVIAKEFDRIVEHLTLHT